MNRVARTRTNVSTGPGRTIALLLVSAGVLVGGAALVKKGLNTVRTSKEGRSATGAPQTQAELPATTAFLLAAMDRTGRPVSFTLLAPAASGGGTVMVLPASARVDSATSVQSSRLADASTRGQAEQANAVAKFLGVTFDATFFADEAALTAFLTPYAPIDITLDAAVLDTDASRADRVVRDLGPASLSAAEAAQVMLARVEGESELLRLPRVEAIWKAVSAKAATIPAAAGAAGSLQAVTGPLLHGPSSVITLASGAVADKSRNVAGLAMVDVDIVDIRMRTAEIIPGSVVPPPNKLRVELRDPFKDEALVRQTVTLLTFMGAHVVFVHGTNELPLPKTSVQFQTDSTQPGADFLAKALNKGPAVKASESLESVDVTIVLGSDSKDKIATRVAPTAAGATTVVSTTNP